MKQSSYTVQIIEPSEGFKLTQASEVSDENRIFSDKIFLAINDSPSNWKEVPNEDAEACKARVIAKHEKDNK